MRKAAHLFRAVAVLLGIVVGATFLAAAEPTLRGRQFLELDSLVTEDSADFETQLTRAEPPIEVTDPAPLVQLARRYQPTLVTSAMDRFWPMSVLDTFKFRWQGRATCLYIDGECRREPPRASDLEGGASTDYLQFPTGVNKIQDAFRSAARALGSPIDAIVNWRARATQLNPFKSAQFYFYYLRKPPHHAYRGVPDGLTSLEYWFFYPLNYLPLVKRPLQTLVNPIGATISNGDYHQGDFEHVAVLLDSNTGRPRYLWMARHEDEGVAFPWRSKRVQWDGDHPVVYAGFGGHATYPHCGIQRRGRTFKFVNDYVVCIRGLNYGFTHASTPLVDLAHTTWGCWRGHLGKSGRHLNRGRVKFVPYETDGPVSPLRQQENAAAC